MVVMRSRMSPLPLMCSEGVWNIRPRLTTREGLYSAPTRKMKRLMLMSMERCCWRSIGLAAASPVDAMGTTTSPSMTVVSVSALALMTLKKAEMPKDSGGENR